MSGWVAGHQYFLNCVSNDYIPLWNNKLIFCTDVKDRYGYLATCNIWRISFFHSTYDIIHGTTIQFSRSVVSDSLQPHEPQPARSPTNSWSLPKLMSIELVMPSNHLILCHPLLLLPSILPSIRVFSNESALCISWRASASASASASVLLVNIQDWFPLRWTGCISLLYTWN